MDFKSIFSHFALATLLISFTGCEGCGFGECIGGGDHSFEQKIVFEPEWFQYHIGDTIQVHSKFNCMAMLNSVTGVEEDYCGFKNLGASLQILLLDRHLPAAAKRAHLSEY